MATQWSETGEGASPLLDFTAGPFVTRRDEVNEIISTLSQLYIKSDEEGEEDDSAGPEDLGGLPEWPLPPPPPPESIKRDIQLERWFFTLTPLASTPSLPTRSVVHTPDDHGQSQPTITSLSTVPLKPPIKLEFPRGLRGRGRKTAKTDDKGLRRISGILLSSTEPYVFAGQRICLRRIYSKPF
ncbi:hypothetical protein MHYP_G00307140 [Metynnis hypsauchen]